MINILFVGFGNIGSVFALSVESYFNKTGQTSASFYCIKKTLPSVDKHSSGIKFIENFSNINCVFDYIFLLTKPQDAEVAISKITPQLVNNNTIFVSIMAGLTTQNIEFLLLKHLKLNNNLKICRVMPNIAINIGKSVTGIFYRNMPEAKIFQIDQICQSFGMNINCTEEAEIDLITIISGSGIGFASEIMSYFLTSSKAIYNKGEINLAEVVCNIFLSAAAMINGDGEGFANLTSRVASKGGTTEAGLNAIRTNGIEDGIKQAFELSLKKAKNIV